MKIKLICRPTLIEENIESFLDSEKQTWRRTEGATMAEELIEFSGRICYMSFGSKQSPKTNNRFIENLIKKDHDSVFEHASWTFIVTGITRSFTHQLVRHRIGFSYSQLSQQYYDHETIDYIEHQELMRDEELKNEWKKALQSTKAAYSNIIQSLSQKYRQRLKEGDRKTKIETLRMIRSVARSILPNCIDTKIVFSANARSIRHFIELRGNIFGDLEMRIFCNNLFEIMKQEAPSLFCDFNTILHDDGYPIVKKIRLK